MAASAAGSARLIRSKALAGLAGVLLALLLPGQAAAHEPVFSLGPETIYKGGFGVEAELEFEEAGKEKETALHYEAIYGVTENLAVTAVLPHVLGKKDGAAESEGLGEVALRGKYQFFRRDRLGVQDKATVIYGVKLPTGSEDETPALGSGSADHLFGLSLGHESTTWYAFATGRYVLRPDGGPRNKGDRVLLDLAGGLRPWLRPYKEWDLVVLWENSYIHEGRDERDGATVPDTGGHTWLMGPTFLWSVRNVMVKGGAQFSAWQDRHGSQDETEWRGTLAVEYHF